MWRLCAGGLGLPVGSRSRNRALATHSTEVLRTAGMNAYSTEPPGR
jgi:hypothetical protein